jgi:hypothetical protein
VPAGLTACLPFPLLAAPRELQGSRVIETGHTCCWDTLRLHPTLGNLGVTDTGISEGCGLSGPREPSEGYLLGPPTPTFLRPVVGLINDLWDWGGAYYLVNVKF